MKNLKFKGLILLFLTLTGYLQAQEKTVVGVIKDESGMVLAGASIAVKLTNNGVSSDSDGKYSIRVDEKDVLTVSFVGLSTQEIAVKGKTTINVIMKEGSKALEEVVVVGYTSQKSNKISGSVAVVKAAQLRDVTEGDVGKMLQGKVSGVFVGSSNGEPGAAPVIRIRGNSTITAGADPLYVVDGVIGGIPNPSDVETMTILKDAASTTLYGARAANGVIVVTTKRGKAGKTQFDFRTTSGFGRLDNGKFKLMNATQLYDTYARALANAGNTPAEIEDLLPASRKNVDTNWQDVAYQNAINTSYELNISGGSDKTRFYLGSNYYKEQGILVGTGFDRYSLRLNLDHNISDKLKISTNLATTITKSDQSADAASYESYTNLPWDRAFDENGNAINPNTANEWFGRDYSNFAFERQYNHTKSNNLALDGMFKAEYAITKALSFSSTNRAEFGHYLYESYLDVRSVYGGYANGSLYNANDSYRTYLTSNLLKYDKTLGNHQVQLLLGHEYQLNEYRYDSSSKTGFLPGLDVLGAGALAVSIDGNRTTNKFLSGFMQANYNYASKYFLTSSFRRDGSSRFGSNNPYANFYAVGGSWIVSKETFMEALPAVSNLKLRASYGTTGNAEITRAGGGANYYGGIDYYNVNSSYNGNAGAIFYQIGNKDLTWEKSATLDFGIDLSLFKDRIAFTFDFYNKKTSDLLFNLPQPANVGVDAITQNVGAVKNVGFEYGLNTKNLVGAFKWSTDFNISFNKNEITSLYNGLLFADVSGFGGQRLLVGQDMHTWFLRKWVGVDPANGNPLWDLGAVDPITGKTTTSVYRDAPLQVVGKGTPDFFGGIRNTFSYKGFELNALMNFVSGNDILNGDRALFDSDGAYDTYNMMQLQDGWNRWEKAGDVATHPKLIGGGNMNSQRSSSRFLEDGSYLRLRNVTFSYNIPTSQLERIHIRSARISISGDNLYTWTKFSGIDPEVDDFASVGTKYPFAKKFLLGVQLGF